MSRGALNLLGFEAVPPTEVRMDITGLDATGLALAAGRGDRDAATAFIRATQRDVMRFLAPLTTASDVEDLTQETYLRAVRSRPEFAGRSSARTWLFAIARRVAADHVRHATRRP